LKCRLTTTHEGARQGIVHYGSKYLFFGPRGLLRPHPYCRVVVTWYHVAPGDERFFGMIPKALRFVDHWHTACTLTRDKLIAAGIPAGRLTIIPLGVDTACFSPPSEEERLRMRQQVGAAKNAIVIGSFQKDGCGWGDGNEPKLIKGPDIFCDAVERLAKGFPVHVVLTGPARGYVRTRLTKAGIPVFHVYLRSPSEVADYYKALDLYLMCSREEGGPQSVLESLASGVPLVAADAGLSRDVIRNGENAFLIPVGDASGFVEAARRILSSKDLAGRLKKEGPVCVQDYDWARIARRMYDEVYVPVLNRQGKG
jgi:glycosyltransferase involved in cell wall biosynthesis